MIRCISKPIEMSRANNVHGVYYKVQNMNILKYRDLPINTFLHKVAYLFFLLFLSSNFYQNRLSWPQFNNTRNPPPHINIPNIYTRPPTRSGRPCHSTRTRDRPSRLTRSRPRTNTIIIKISASGSRSA